jgi:hypothetical protein
MAVQGGPSNMSGESCITACDTAKYKYAGTEYSSECYVSFVIPLFQSCRNFGTKPSSQSAAILWTTNRRSRTMAVTWLAMGT